MVSDSCFGTMVLSRCVTRVPSMIGRNIISMCVTVVVGVVQVHCSWLTSTPIIYMTTMISLSFSSCTGTASATPTIAFVKCCDHRESFNQLSIGFHQVVRNLGVSVFLSTIVVFSNCSIASAVSEQKSCIVFTLCWANPAPAEVTWFFFES